jgi:hypothetical protein
MVRLLGAGVAVGRETGTSDGIGVVSGCAVEKPQAIIKTRNNEKHKNLIVLFENRMAWSFLTKSICQLYKQAAH